MARETITVCEFKEKKGEESRIDFPFLLDKIHSENTL